MVQALQPEVLPPVKLELLPSRPWVATLQEPAGPEAIANELYGIPLPEYVKKVEVFSFEEFAIVDAYEITPSLLQPNYRSQFHDLMKREMEKDVDRVESILFETRIDADDEDSLIRYVRFWSAARDMRAPAGESYFDAFLGRLKQDQWYTDYGLWESERQSYLDLLYTEVEERKGELNALIARNSVAYGGYRPIWTSVDPEGSLKESLPNFQVNTELVKTSANMVLDALAGYTSGDDSQIIRDTLVGLPPPEQAAVLKNIMSRYDETDWTGIFGRYGEAWETGMLYYLFEDLDDSDSKKVADALKESGVLPTETVDALVAGRGFVAKYLPYTTRKGQEATMYWADMAVREDSTVAKVMGSFSALWMPETAGQTITTLAGARVFPAVGQMSPTLGRGMLLLGTGAASYELGIAAQELVTGKDIWTGEELQREEKISRLLSAGANALFLAAGFVGARGMTVEPSAGAGPSGPGGAAQIRVTNPAEFRASTPYRNPRTGDISVIGQHGPSGVRIHVRLNPASGQGTVTQLGGNRSVHFSTGRGTSRLGAPASNDNALPPNVVPLRPPVAPVAPVTPRATPYTGGSAAPNLQPAPAIAPQPQIVPAQPQPGKVIPLPLPAPAPAPVPAPPVPAPVPAPLLSGAGAISSQLTPEPEPVPQPQPAPQPEEDEDTDDQPLQIRLVLPAEKALHALLYRSLIRQRSLVHSTTRSRRDNPTRQRTRWDSALRPPSGPMAIYQEIWRKFEKMNISEDRRLRPDWSKTRKFMRSPYGGRERSLPFEVDHMLEWQVRPLNQDNLWDSIVNYELLEREANGRSGRDLDRNIAEERARLVRETGDVGWQTRDLVFTTLVLAEGNANPERWLAEEIQVGKHYHYLLWHLGESPRP